MGKSYADRYQVGRSYRIKNTIYDVVASGGKEFAGKKAGHFKYAMLRKDGSTYAVLVPVAPSFSADITDFREQMKKYHPNWKKLRKVM